MSPAARWRFFPRPAAAVAAQATQEEGSMATETESGVALLLLRPQ
jgi:hypothetical protein